MDALFSSVQEVPGLRLSANPVLEIGGEGDPAREFVAIGGVGPMSDGRVVVGDAGARQIRVFAPDGVHLLTLGGSGEDPGEFGSLDALWTEGNRLIGAWDAENQRITTFDAHAPEPVSRTGRLDIPASSGMGNAPQAFLGAFPNGEVFPEVGGMLPADGIGLLGVERVAVHSLED